ncbi:MAG: class I SAM-dependent methyltransferase [Hasllibacter sp.]
MTHPEAVAQHYARPDLIERIDAGLREAGLDPAAIGIQDLKPIDEFHTGGVEATSALLDRLDIDADTAVLDIGCGIGGTARHVLQRYGARVAGIDLTAEFVAAGRALNERLGLSDAIDLRTGSALDLPWPDGAFDLVTMFHVGMNLPDKAALFAEVARVLRPGGRFALFDLMRGEQDGDLAYPVPWARDGTTSHVDAPGAYRRAAHAAGLTEEAERDRRDFALDYFARVLRKSAAEGPPPLGIHLLMAGDPAEKLRNAIANIETGRIVPVEMIFRHRR